MKFQNSFVFLAFWWAVVFPNFFFSNDELVKLENNDVSYRFWICDVLGDN